MTSIRRKPTVLGSRRNTIEQEREHFQRNQEASFRKAINEEEVPVKMKHVRNLIIGTHTDRNGNAFWGLVVLSPPLHTDVTAWKFCHTLHLILRDGHQHALKDSIQHISRIKNMGEHFCHLPAGYGGLIQRYCSLLICKLNFHMHYPRFPGNLQVSPEELESIAENDANNYFEMAVEMLEYMEKILKLYEAVFESLDPSRANSMTKMGQCRLSPLIPCIQDSSSLYDFTVRILFKLHKIVSIDMLSGHRTRFNQQFKILHNFYNSTRNLQYFKTLIHVPHLPQVAPNFLVEAELGSHIAPVVVVEEELPDPVETQDLVDTSDPSPPPVPPHPHPDIVNSHNGSMMEVIAERDSMIEALQEELRESRITIQTLRSENSFVQDQLRLKVNELESTLAELDSELTAERKSKESVLAQVEAATASAEAVTRLSDEENRRRIAEEKFAKMKEVYQKLRDEHIALIRTKAEMEKSLREEQDSLMKGERQVQLLTAKLSGYDETNQSIEAAMQENLALEEKVRLLTREKDEAVADKDSVWKVLQDAKAKIESQVEDLETKRTDLEATLNKVTGERAKLIEIYDAQEVLVADLRTSLENLQKVASTKVREARAEADHALELCIAASVKSGTTFIGFATSHFDNEAHRLLKASPDYTLLYREPLEHSVGELRVASESFAACGGALAAKDVVRATGDLAAAVAPFLLFAKATSHASPHIDVAESLVNSLEELATKSSQYLEGARSKTLSSQNSEGLIDTIERCCKLLSGCEDLTASKEDMSTMLEREIEAMNGAIMEAVEKFSHLLEESRAKDFGVQLEVNEGILATCSELMGAVRLLVQRASELQREVVASGKSTASPKEFYKRNHRWTEGLISGAKAVAIACQALVTAADDVVGRRGKFEEVMVASREIAASSMQLVMASRVKADKESQRLANLNAAAKTISTLTGTVVATAESCRDKVAEAVNLDFSKLSLHSTKRLEMETLVKVLETEKKLEVERTKLANLRRHHYQLAGELEGWDEEDIPK